MIKVGHSKYIGAVPVGVKLESFRGAKDAKVLWLCARFDVPWSLILFKGKALPINFSRMILCSGFFTALGPQLFQTSFLE